VGSLSILSFFNVQFGLLLYFDKALKSTGHQPECVPLCCGVAGVCPWSSPWPLGSASLKQHPRRPLGFTGKEKRDLPHLNGNRGTYRTYLNITDRTAVFLSVKGTISSPS
jgi:hypothetical protein